MTSRGALQCKLFCDSNFVLCLHFKTELSFADVWYFGNHITGISLIKRTSYFSKVLTHLSAAWHISSVTEVISLPWNYRHLLTALEKKDYTTGYSCQIRALNIDCILETMF